MSEEDFAVVLAADGLPLEANRAAEITGTNGGSGPTPMEGVLAQ